MGLLVLADAIQGDPALADFADVDGLFFHVGFAHKNAAVQA